MRDIIIRKVANGYLTMPADTDRHGVDAEEVNVFGTFTDLTEWLLLYFVKEEGM